MTSERLRKLVTVQPFQPFRISVTNGQVYEVKHPEFVAISPRDDIAILFHENGDYSVLDLLLMTEINVEGTSHAQSS